MKKQREFKISFGEMALTKFGPDYHPQVTAVGEVEIRDHEEIVVREVSPERDQLFEEMYQSLMAIFRAVKFGHSFNLEDAQKCLSEYERLKDENN